ncbi:hypothetical protein GN956_G11983 [Arapaima gigas]
MRFISASFSRRPAKGPERQSVCRAAAVRFLTDCAPEKLLCRNTKCRAENRGAERRPGLKTRFPHPPAPRSWSKV